jgi:hypothetical protein
MQTGETQVGITQTVEWLRKTGRPILADKMERELLNCQAEASAANRSPHRLLNDLPRQCHRLP